VACANRSGVIEKLRSCSEFRYRVYSVVTQKEGLLDCNVSGPLQEHKVVTAGVGQFYHVEPVFTERLHDFHRRVEGNGFRDVRVLRLERFLPASDSRHRRAFSSVRDSSEVWRGEPPPQGCPLCVATGPFPEMHASTVWEAAFICLAANTTVSATTRASPIVIDRVQPKLRPAKTSRKTKIIKRLLERTIKSHRFISA